MKFGQENAPDVQFDADSQKRQIDRLKGIERQFGWHAEEWHFRLVPQFDEPMKIYSWFGSAKLVGNRMYFDGSAPKGNVCYDWVRKNYAHKVKAALGEIDYCLASRGAILRSTNGE